MVIGCLGVERRAERFFSYLAILKGISPNPVNEKETVSLFQVTNNNYFFLKKNRCLF